MTLSTTGGAMFGPIDMNGNTILDLSETIYSTNPTPDTPSPNGITLYTSNNQLKYIDPTGAVFIVGTAVVGGYLPISGGTMTGVIDMGANNISNAGTLSGSTTSRAVNNITSCATSGVSGNISTFTGTAKVLQDSGVLLSSLLSSSTAAATYLPLTGGTMFGNINLGTYGIGLGATANSGTCIGNGSNCGNNASVALGNLANAAGFGAISIGNASVCSTNNSLALGLSANNSAVGGVAIGRQCVNSGIDAISIGTNANCSFPRAICIGTSSAASVTGAIALGYAANNSTANSLLVGVTANIRSTVTTCDLGTAAVPFQSLYINSNVSGPTNSRSVDNIVSNTGTAVSGRVTTFLTDKVIQDSGTLLSDLATNASVLAAGAGYLAKAGGTMTGSINFGQNNATGFNYIQSGITAGNVIWGSGTTISTPPPGNNIRNVYLGYNNDGVGFALNLIGNECHQTVGAGLCNLIGSSLNVIGASSSAYGDGTTVTGTTSVAIGSNNTISVSNGYVFGAGATNSIANSMLLGSVNITNIRANGTTCDLGTAAAPFRNLILNTGIESTAGLVIGPASATSIAIGRATVTTTINGIFATPLPFGTWYSTTTFNPSFAAGVNRLTQPTAAIAGPLVDFTHALGVLTYTGTRTRQFHIAYNITFTAGPNGTNMTFFNSIAASTIIGTTQSQQRQQVTTQLASTQMSLTVIDIITLTTGQSAQLAGACATISAAIGYNFISCAISAMPN